MSCRYLQGLQLRQVPNLIWQAPNLWSCSRTTPLLLHGQPTPYICCKRTYSDSSSGRLPTHLAGPKPCHVVTGMPSAKYAPTMSVADALTVTPVEAGSQLHLAAGAGHCWTATCAREQHDTQVLLWSRTVCLCCYQTEDAYEGLHSASTHALLLRLHLKQLRLTQTCHRHGIYCSRDIMISRVISRVIGTWRKCAGNHSHNAL